MNVQCISSKAGREFSTLPRADIKNEEAHLHPPIRLCSAHRATFSLTASETDSSVYILSAPQPLTIFGSSGDFERV